MRSTLVACLASLPLIAGCSSHSEASERHFLLVVEESLAEPLDASLRQYAENMSIASIEVHVESWSPGTAQALQGLIFEYIDVQGIEGALLIGDLPAAWYEQRAFGRDEEFPFDLYFQDRDAVWDDADGDGIFDGHSELELDIYTSRLHGTSEELVDYFARAYSYRWDGPLVDVSAFIFIDDDWSLANTEGAFNLPLLYSNVDILNERSDSTETAYLEKMTGDGAEFVYQWIHSSPRVMLIHDASGDEGQRPAQLWQWEVRERNLKGSFYNLFNCSAARFTNDENLARAYVIGTDYGLAAIGSTKTGAVARPHIFHGNLVLGRRWGEAYQIWFNEEGRTDDRWHLGVVLIGDPLLRLTGDLFPWGYGDNTSTQPGDLDDIDAIMEGIAENAELGTYEQYREENPEFFD